MKLLVAIPCLNEEKNIGKVINDIRSSSVQTLPDLSLEILVVDDGSTDKTGEEAAKAGATVISHTGNKGLGIAFQTALNYAARCQADIMVNMDGDGQFDPADIKRLITPIIRNECDVAMGSRFIDKKPIMNMPKIKYWGNIGMAGIISHLCRNKFYDVSCGFRAYSKETILRSNFHGKYTYTQEAFIFYSTQNLKIQEIPVTVRYFTDRKSRVAGNLFKYGKKTMGIILSLYRDYYPMRLFSTIAVLLLLVAIGFGLPFVMHFMETGYFRDYLFAGFISAFTLALSIVFEAIGIIMQGSTRIQENQNRILYYMKKMDGINSYIKK